MVELLKYGQAMNSQLLAEVLTSTAVSDTSLLKETLKINYIRCHVAKSVRHFHFFWFMMHLPNSYFVFRRGFQTLEN